MPGTETALHAHLTELAQSNDSLLVKDVARILLDEGHEGLARYLDDLFQHGCISGMVGELISYADTQAFYDRHYDEIEHLRETYEEETGVTIVIQGDLKNFFAWFAFEQTAYEIAREFGW